MSSFFNEKKEESFVPRQVDLTPKISTIRLIAEGGQASIYLAQREGDENLVCVKVFKQYTQDSLKECAEKEYRVSQIL